MAIPASTPRKFPATKSSFWSACGAAWRRNWRPRRLAPAGNPGATRLGRLGRGAGGAAAAAAPVHYAEAMVALRDEIGEARLEDVPQLVAQMERLQGVALTRAQLQTILVDVASPYFGHLRLREEVAGRGVVEKDVLIGRATYVDPKTRVNIVDWRNAPVSQLYYRYGEGSDYEERFGEREVEGEILVRRTLTIEGGMLQRIAAPQGIWVKRRLAEVPDQAAPGRNERGGRGRGQQRTGTSGSAAICRSTSSPVASRAPRGPRGSFGPAGCWARRPPGDRPWTAICPRSPR